MITIAGENTVEISCAISEQRRVSASLVWLIPQAWVRSPKLGIDSPQSFDFSQKVFDRLEIVCC
jgi:hypothetical protein